MSFDGRVITLLILGILAGVYLFISGLRNWKWKRLIENTPTSKIRGLAMGLVEVCGSVQVPLKTYLKSPFTAKDCVYYNYTIEELRSSGKRSHWVTIHSDIKAVPFYLKDQTGAVLVDIRGADIDLPAAVSFETSTFSTVPKQIQTFCEKSNLSVQSWFFGLNKKLKFTEYNMVPKDELYIMGTAADNPHCDETTAKHSVEDIMIQKGKSIPFYYISHKGEKQALANFAWKVYGGIGGGSAVFLLSLAWLLAIMGWL